MSTTHAHRYVAIDDGEVSEILDLCAPCARSKSDDIDGPVNGPDIHPDDDYECDGCGRHIHRGSHWTRVL